MRTQTSLQIARENTLLGQYLGFLKHPNIAPSSLKPEKILARIWRLYSVHVLLMVPMVIAISLLSEFIQGIEDNKVGDFMENVSLLTVLMLVVIAAPLMEELIFRLPLRFSGRNFAIVGAFLSLMVFGSITPTLGSPATGLLLFLVLFLVLSMGPLVVCSRITPAKGEAFFQKIAKLLIYGSSVVFGLVHITNYPMSAWIVFPILVLPQTTLGVLLAYVRLKFGIWWAVLTHALHNFLITSPLLFIGLGSAQLRESIFESGDFNADLGPRDMIALGLMTVWFFGVLFMILKTALKMIMDWKNAQPAAS